MATLLQRCPNQDGGEFSHIGYYTANSVCCLSKKLPEQMRWLCNYTCRNFKHQESIKTLLVLQVFFKFPGIFHAMNAQELSAVYTLHVILVHWSLEEFCSRFKWRHVFYIYILSAHLLIYWTHNSNDDGPRSVFSLAHLTILWTPCLLIFEHLKWIP